ncbi:protein KTI12 homolog isoform X1 [Schistocerca americana]|uniref:protein KTI12 homolog isoform X1 n=2 Tax=Schistocerca americana TaxID=7009 RepID=UPI001F4F3478|nr:protein KTI12 homolog isoform X1 [Schistocerca americana]
MPLIIITGYPSSGKTTRASQLKEYFEERMKKTVHTVNEETVMKTMGEDRNSLFTDSAKEKALRGAIKSEVQRFIDKESVIIIDAGNYIKGYRYELYCISKGAGTTQCTIHCGVDEDTVHRWNSKRECGYKEDVLRALIMRYEAPDSRNRWDYPLFTALFTDDLNYDEIYSSLFERKPPPPNQSTQCAPLSSTNFLYELDKVTQEILSAILSAQKLGVDSEIKIPGFKDSVRTNGVKLSVPQLSRLRRQFLSYTKLHPSNDISKIGPLFIQFLNSNIT